MPVKPTIDITADDERVSVQVNEGDEPRQVSLDELADVEWCLREDVWITREGEVIALSAMEDSHLRHAIAILTPWSKQDCDEDRRRELKTWTSKFKKEVRRREKARRKQGLPNKHARKI